MKNCFVTKLRFPPDNVHVLNEGKGPTAKEVLDTITRLQKSGCICPKDIFVVYYSGHGMVGENNTFKFCTQSEHLSADAMCKAVADLGVKRVVFLIDACEAAGFSGNQIFSQLARDSKIAVLAASTAFKNTSGDSTFSKLFARACQNLLRDKQLCLNHAQVYATMMMLDMKATSNMGIYGTPFEFAPLHKVWQFEASYTHVRIPVYLTSVNAFTTFVYVLYSNKSAAYSSML